MAPTGFTINQNIMHEVIWGHIYILNIKIRIKDNTWNDIIFIIIQDTFAKLGVQRLVFIDKVMYGLINDGNY